MIAPTFSELHRQANEEAEAIAKRAEEQYYSLAGKDPDRQGPESDADARFRLAYAHGYLTSSLARALLRIKQLENGQKEEWL